MKIQITDTWEAPKTYCSDRCSPVFIKNVIASVTYNEKIVNIWEPNVAHNKKISLVGHERKVTALAVSPKCQSLICTCSDDKIILWNMNFQCNEDAVTDGTTSPEGVTFAFDFGYIEYCTFSWNNEWIALCRENEILIIKIKWHQNEKNNFDVEHHATVETNSGHGNLCSFSPVNSEIIVTTEDTSYFKVWNIVTMTLLYKSSKVGIYTITHCSFANNPPYLLLGTNGGTVYVYIIKENDIPSCLMNVNVGKAFLSNDENSECDEMDYGLKQKHSSTSIDLKEESGEIGCITFGVYLFRWKMQPDSNEELLENKGISDFFSESDRILKSILNPRAVVAACCNLGIALYNCNSWECEAVLKTCDMFPPSVLTPKTLPLLSFLVIGGDSVDNFTCILKMSLNNSNVHVLKFNVVYEKAEYGKRDAQEMDTITTETSVVPLKPVQKLSPLRYQMYPKMQAQSNPYAPKHSTLTRNTKSSGYGKPPRTQMFCPIINKSKNRSQLKNILVANKKLLQPSITSVECTDEKVEDEIKSGPPVKAGAKFCLWDTNGTAVQLAVTGDGENLACSSTASYICILKSNNMDPEKGLNLVGHNGAINSLHFSLNSQWLISASCDASAKVWDWKNKKCILNINNSIPSQTVLHSSYKKEQVRNSISQARFYYMDQFILTASQDCLALFSHLMHEMDADQVYNSLIKSKRVWKINVPAQQVTCFSAVNQFHSYIILCCCSNRTLQVYDMNEDKYVTSFKNIHSRPAHHIKQMEGSQALAHPPGMYNLFITAALCDSTKLWDLRSARCVQKYCQHVNRAYTCGIDISPCGCYIATGSEDKYVYLYDTRKCTDYLQKLGGLGETVMDVSFNPRTPMLAAAALNGCVTSYSAF